MKTLDEVIKAMDMCINDGDAQNCLGCPYAEEDGEAACYGHDREDALYYLKKLNRIEDAMEKIALGNLEETLSKMDNPPLTWDELKTLVGKPVWIEGKTVKHWAVITGIYYDDLNEGYLLETYYAEKQGSNTNRRKRNMLGKSWQAYRKERQNVQS